MHQMPRSALRPTGLRPTSSGRVGLRLALLAPLALATSACSGLPTGVLPLGSSRTPIPPSASSVPAVSRAPVPATQPAVRVVASGWGQTAGNTWVTATIRDDGAGAGSSAVTFTAFGSEDRVLAFGTSAVVQVVPGQTTAVGTLLDVPPGEAVVRLRADVSTKPVQRPRETHYIIGGVNVQARAQASPRLLAVLTTPQAAPTLVTAVCTDKRGRILGGGATSLGTTAAGGLRAFAVDPLVVPAVPARCSVYTAVTAG
jgi:hypothetical protein